MNLTTNKISENWLAIAGVASLLITIGALVQRLSTDEAAILEIRSHDPAVQEIRIGKIESDVSYIRSRIDRTKPE